MKLYYCWYRGGNSHINYIAFIRIAQKCVMISIRYTYQQVIQPKNDLHNTCAWNTCADNELSLIACQYFKQHIISVLNLAFKKIQILKAKKWTSWKNPKHKYIKTWTGDRRVGVDLMTQSTWKSRCLKKIYNSSICSR